MACLRPATVEARKYASIGGAAPGARTMGELRLLQLWQQLNARVISRGQCSVISLWAAVVRALSQAGPPITATSMM